MLGQPAVLDFWSSKCLTVDGLGVFMFCCLYFQEFHNPLG